MVKTIRTTSIIICLFSWFIVANNEELFLRAHKLYALHDYDQALILYEKITPKGRAVLYNIGNCHFHKNDYAHALVYWKRARKGATPKEYAAIKHNEAYVLQKLHKRTTNSFYAKMLELMTLIFVYCSAFLLQLLFCVLWIVLLFLCYRNRYKIIQLLLIMILFFLALLLFMYQVERSVTYGIITKKRTAVYACPDKGFDEVGSVEYADNVTVKEIRQGWYKIRSFDTIGWVEADAIEII